MGWARLGDQRAIGGVIGEPARAVEDGQGAVLVFVDVDANLREMLPMPLLEGLQAPPVKPARSCHCHDALVLGAQDVGHVADEWHEGRARLGRRNGELDVVFGPIGLG